MIGLGGLGYNGACVAVLKGAEVYAADIGPSTREHAAEMGLAGVAESITESADKDLPLIVDYAGLGTTTAQAVDTLAKSGTLVQVGLGRLEATINTQALILEQLRILGSLQGTQQDLADLYELMCSGELDPPLNRITPQRAPTAWNACARAASSASSSPSTPLETPAWPAARPRQKRPRRAGRSGVLRRPRSESSRRAAPAGRHHRRSGITTCAYTGCPKPARAPSSRDRFPPPAPVVLVRVHATSLNARDLFMLDGRYPVPADRVPLSDAAGVIEATGPGATRFKAGDRVVNSFNPLWFGGTPSAHPARTTTPTSTGGWPNTSPSTNSGWCPSPSISTAATLPCATVTAYSALEGVGPGVTVLVQGWGGVSLFALQLARAACARVIATTSSEKKAARLRELGASDVVNYRTTPQGGGDEGRRLTGGQGPTWSWRSAVWGRSRSRSRPPPTAAPSRWSATSRSAAMPNTHRWMKSYWPSPTT
ncbi:zinc-binding dehydrogenase [Streptomyces althioticus]